METSLNYYSFGVAQDAWTALSEQELLCFDGGRNWVATIAGTVAGVATCVGAGWTGAGAVAGYATIAAGVATIVWAWA